jgi:hypothetical protein
MVLAAQPTKFKFKGEDGARKGRRYKGKGKMTGLKPAWR